eukprot:g28978.t1
MGLKNFSECIADCKKVLQLDQQNRDAKILLRQAIADQKEADKKSKAVFASMCKAFGKDSTNDVVPEQPRPQEKQMIQERRNCDDQQVLVCVLQDFCAAKQGILSTVIQGVSRAMFFFPNLDSCLIKLEIKQSELSMGASMHSSEASPEMRHIRVLENRLDKTMIKYNEAQSIRKTYEAIVKRLKEERMGFDNQLAGIERTLKAKERDYEELLLLSHDAYHAKEMAQAELHRFEQGVMEERNQRDKEALVEQRVEMNKRLEMRERIQKQQQQQDHRLRPQRSGLRAEPEVDQAQRSQGRELPAADTSGAVPADVGEDDQKIQLFIHAFNQIKEASGVNDPNEIIQKP